MNTIEKEQIYSYIDQELKKRYKNDIERVYVDIDEKRGIINVLVLTKEINPELESEIFKFEKEIEEKKKINSSFHVAPLSSTLGGFVSYC